MRRGKNTKLNNFFGVFSRSNSLRKCFSSIFKAGIATALFFMLVLSVSAAMQTNFGLQGKITAANGEIIPSGNITVKISETNNTNCVLNQIYSQTFVNALQNSIFNVMIDANLEYNKDYWLCVFLNDGTDSIGGPYRFRGGQGEVDLEDLAAVLSETGRDFNVANVLYVNTSSGRVGIGTTDPSYQLEVNGTVGLQGDLDMKTNKIFFGDAQQANIAYDADYEGIATSALNLGSGHLILGKMEVGSSYLTIYGGKNWYWDGGSNYFVGLTGIGLQGESATGRPSNRIEISDYTEGVSFIGNYPVTFLSGNVGIGTTDPKAKLDVKGDIGLTGGVIGLNYSGYVDTGRSLTPWDASGEYSVSGWYNVNEFSITRDNTQSYRGSYSIKGSRTGSTGAGGMGYTLGNLKPGKYSLSGYFKCPSSFGSFGISLRDAGTSCFSGGTSYSKIYSCNDTWQYFSQSMIVTDNANNEFVWMATDLQNGEYVYFDELYLTEGTLSPAMSNPIMSTGSGDTIVKYGNVGIGTTDPKAKLDVAGNLKIGSSSTTCDANHRGEFRFVAGASGTPDYLYMCMNADDTYNWIQVAYGG